MTKSNFRTRAIAFTTCSQTSTCARKTIIMVFIALQNYVFINDAVALLLRHDGSDN